MIERYILEALQKAVTTAVTATGSPPVKYIGRNTPSNSGKWWEIIYIPNNVENEFWDSGKTYRGIMRLILHWPQDDTGAYGALDEVKRVADAFKKGDISTDAGSHAVVRIMEHPNVLSIIEQPPEMLIPLTIRYTCFKV